MRGNSDSQKSCSKDRRSRGYSGYTEADSVAALARQKAAAAVTKTCTQRTEAAAAKEAAVKTVREAETEVFIRSAAPCEKF